ncbi:oligoribonuclease [Bacillus sp. FJAT-27916]|uniref:DHH family phosphoesterase n=1 Tax=Bacillaceae TaxID=186817 RepID=UPI000670BC0A|nr:bifunctional oligoribonuclease/PAP phosphatase NrnA [Bacillus sp. FJAT-27916]KMY43506.1 oligoribonuclease [Bacillus sp. FJAT-27916]
MKERILDAIKQYETIIIHRHVRPDPDAYGSQCGLGEIIKASFPEKNVYMVGQEEESLRFLKELDQIPDSVYEKALVIVCDTANQERVCDQRYTMGDQLIKIDHHPNDDVYGDIVWVDTSASSCSEMIYDFYMFGKDKGLTMNKEAARLLYAGIVGDTGRFLYPSTTDKTFQYAGELIHYGFDRTSLYNGIYDVDEAVARLNGYVFENFKMDKNGVGSMVITKEIMARFGVNASQASLLVSTLGGIKGLKAWVFFIEENNDIRVRLRSKGPVINGIAKKYNGGGHPLASGATIYDWADVDKVIADLVAVCQADK